MTFLRHSGDRHSGRDPQQEEECPEEARELQGRLCQVLRLTFSRETKSERHSRPEEGAERRGNDPGLPEVLQKLQQRRQEELIHQQRHKRVQVQAERPEAVIGSVKNS